jgi:hypothetical protein
VSAVHAAQAATDLLQHAGQSAVIVDSKLRPRSEVADVLEGQMPLELLQLEPM